MVSLRKTARIQKPDPALARVRRTHKSLYDALQRVRAGQACLSKEEKVRPLTAAERKQLWALTQEHQRLRQEIDQLVLELGRITGEPGPLTLTL